MNVGSGVHVAAWSNSHTHNVHKAVRTGLTLELPLDASVCELAGLVHLQARALLSRAGVSNPCIHLDRSGCQELLSLLQHTQRSMAPPAHECWKLNPCCCSVQLQRGHGRCFTHCTAWCPSACRLSALTHVAKRARLYQAGVPDPGIHAGRDTLSVDEDGSMQVGRPQSGRWMIRLWGGQSHFCGCILQGQCFMQELSHIISDQSSACLQACLLCPCSATCMAV